MCFVACSIDRSVTSSPSHSVGALVTRQDSDCTNPACGVRYVPVHMSSIRNAETLPDQIRKLHQCSECGQPACVACVARPGPEGNFGIPTKEAAILCKRYSHTPAHILGSQV